MSIEIENLDNATVARLSGRLDAAEVSKIKGDLKGIESGKGHKVVLNMAEVNFTDSSGLGLVVSTFRSISEQGGAMVVCGLTPQVRSLFELTRMHRIFDLYDDEEQALKA
ncbi:MAG: anti-sigma factor antagonist [Gammaproteobacteria bacterium]